MNFFNRLINPGNIIKNNDQDKLQIKLFNMFFLNISYKKYVAWLFGIKNSILRILFMYKNCKESWALKNWCFWTLVLEKTLESPLDCKDIQPVHPKGNQSWIFIGRTDAEAETPTLWPPNAKSWLIWKDPDAGKDWRREEKGKTEDEMVGWHQWLSGHEFEQTLGVGDGQGGLACCSPWGRKEPDTTEQLYWTDSNWSVLWLI